jgi:hypothetical protein
VYQKQKVSLENIAIWSVGDGGRRSFQESRSRFDPDTIDVMFCFWLIARSPI